MLIGSRYEQGEQIGEGAMGVVYRGIDTRGGQVVVLKKLKREYADAAMIERFRREGEALRQLNHPNIVKMLDTVSDGGDNYLILELIPGGTLRDLLDQQPRLPLDRLLKIGIELSDALTRAHHLKIIHRDLKPANILMAADGTPRLSDFGIARFGDSLLTEHGVITGTFAYIPPEAFEESEPSPLFDIWAFGVVLYEMLTGTLPYPQRSLPELLKAVLHQSFPRIEELRPDAPVALVDLIHRMLEKDPRSRIPSVRLVGAELEAITTGGVAVSDQTVIEPTVMVNRRFQTSTPLTASKARHNLPAQTTPFVGREAELAELERLIGESRLVTIFAPGGMGKTRLSLEVGGRVLKQTNAFTDGVFFVELAPVTNPQNILSAIAEAVNYPFQASDRSPRQQLLDYFSDKRQLLILDNFEHVVEGAALVNDILQAAPQVHALVTSRVKLNLSGENVFILNPLDFPDWASPAEALNYSAVKLFAQGAARVQPDFSITVTELPHITRICRLVEGLPLGILLASGWLDVLSAAEIADEIQANINFLETERRDFPERQRSIRAVFDYSWALLSPAERDVFMGLSVFRGSFTRDAAQAVTQADLRALHGLVNKSLLRRNAATGRFEVHELLRQYAHGQLEASGRADALHGAHSRCYLTLAAKLTPNLKGEGQLVTLNLFESDIDNLRAAWDWAVDHRDADAINGALEALMLFTEFRSRIEEGRLLLRKARAAWNDDSALAGKLRVRYPDDPPLENFRAGLAAAERSGDQHEIAYCLRLIGHHLSHSDFNHEEGIPLLYASLAGFQQLNDAFYAAYVLDDLGWSFNLTGQNPKHVAVVEQSIALRRQLGDKIGMANALRNMGGATGGFDGSSDLPEKYWAEAKLIAVEMGDRGGVLWNALLLAMQSFIRGDFEQAYEYLGEAQPLVLELNDPMLKGFSLLVRGMLALLDENDLAKGARLIYEGYPPGTPPDFRMTVVNLAFGLLAVESDNYQQLLDNSRELLKLFSNFVGARVQYFAGALVPIVAVIEARYGNYERSAQLLSARYAYSHADWIKRWRRLDVLRTELETKLGAEAFAAIWAAGKEADMLTLSKEVVEKILLEGGFT